MIEVIVVKYRAPKLEKACLSSVIEVTNPGMRYALRVYDNYPANVNLAVIWNKLIKQSLSEYICLLNSDTVISDPRWLDKMIQVFERERNVGAVGPVTNCSGNPQEREVKKSYSVVDYTKQYTNGGYLCGFCLVFPKKVWQHVGGFPENFGFYGQESGFLYKVAAAGYRQMIREDLFVWHKGAGSARLAQRRGELNIRKEKNAGRRMRDLYFRKLFMK